MTQRSCQKITTVFYRDMVTSSLCENAVVKLVHKLSELLADNWMELPDANLFDELKSTKHHC